MGLEDVGIGTGITRKIASLTECLHSQRWYRSRKEGWLTLDTQANGLVTCQHSLNSTGGKPTCAKLLEWSRKLDFGEPELRGLWSKM